MAAERLNDYMQRMYAAQQNNTAVDPKDANRLGFAMLNRPQDFARIYKTLPGFNLGPFSDPIISGAQNYYNRNPGTGPQGGIRGRPNAWMDSLRGVLGTVYSGQPQQNWMDPRTFQQSQNLFTGTDTSRVPGFNNYMNNWRGGIFSNANFSPSSMTRRNGLLG